MVQLRLDVFLNPEKTDMVVCGVSYFASVATIQELHRIGMRFIGVVKKPRRNFPSKYLGSRAKVGRGKWLSMIHEGELYIGALLRVDRERLHFVSSVGTAFPGANIYREHWRRVNGISKLVVTETQIPRIAEMYYAAASIIDRHNRCRQQDLQQEKIFSYVIGLFGLKRHFLLSALFILAFKQIKPRWPYYDVSE